MIPREAVTGMAVLVAIEDAGSISAAAESLELSASAVSKLVSRLEERLGVRLLQRTTRKIALTEAGARYCERARSVLDAIASIEREAEEVQSEPRGTLRITAPTVLGEVRVMPVVLAFQESFPKVTIHAELTDRCVDLVAEGVDLAVRMVAEPPPGLAAKRLDDDVRLLCASPHYLAERPAPRTPDDLADHDIIVFGAGPSVGVLHLLADEASARPIAVHVRGRLRVNNLHAVHRATLAGRGIADLPRYIAEHDIRAGRLVAVLERHVPIARSIFAIWPPSPYTAPKVLRFVESLQTAFARA